MPLAAEAIAGLPGATLDPAALQIALQGHGGQVALGHRADRRAAGVLGQGLDVAIAIARQLLGRRSGVVRVHPAARPGVAPGGAQAACAPLHLARRRLDRRLGQGVEIGGHDARLPRALEGAGRRQRPRLLGDPPAHLVTTPVLDTGIRRGRDVVARAGQNGGFSSLRDMSVMPPLEASSRNHIASRRNGAMGCQRRRPGLLSVARRCFGRFARRDDTIRIASKSIHNVSDK